MKAETRGAIHALPVCAVRVGQKGGQAADPFEKITHLLSGEGTGSRALVGVDDGGGCSELNLGGAGALAEWSLSPVRGGGGGGLAPSDVENESR